PWIGDLAATVDGYDIKITGAIGYKDPQLVLNGCYNIGGASNPTYDPANSFCRQVTRSTADFSTFDLDGREANQSGLEASGVDLSLGFRTDLAGLSGVTWLGRLDTSLLASWLGHFYMQPSAAQPRIDYAGTIADSGTGYATLPRWKG